MLLRFNARDLALVRLAVELYQQQIHGSDIIRCVSSHGKAAWNRQAMFSLKIFNGVFVSTQQPLDEQRKTLQAFLHRRSGGASLDDEDMPADLLGSRILFVHSRDRGYAPVVPHPATHLGTGKAVSARVEGRPSKEKVRLKLLQCDSNRA